MDGAFAAIERANSRLVPGEKQQSDRRGPFVTFANGISYGGGQKVRFVNASEHLANYVTNRFPEIWITLRIIKKFWMSYMQTQMF